MKDLFADKLRAPTNLQAVGTPVLKDLAKRPIWILDLQKLIFRRPTLLRGNLKQLITDKDSLHLRLSSLWGGMKGFVPALK